MFAGGVFFLDEAMGPFDDFFHFRGRHMIIRVYLDKEIHRCLFVDSI